VKGLWLNGTEVGEGGLNAFYAGSHGVPVILATGDLTFTKQFGELVSTQTVTTKEAIGSSVARLHHPEDVKARLRTGTLQALANLEAARPLDTRGPITLRLRSASTTRADIVQAIPDVRRIDGTLVEYDARNMTEAYKLIRLMYRYVTW